MHYPTGAFALNRNVTVIRPINLNGSTLTLGQRKGFSEVTRRISVFFLYLRQKFEETTNSMTPRVQHENL